MVDDTVIYSVGALGGAVLGIVFWCWWKNIRLPRHSRLACYRSEWTTEELGEEGGVYMVDELGYEWVWP